MLCTSAAADFYLPVSRDTPSRLQVALHLLLLCAFLRNQTNEGEKTNRLLLACSALAVLLQLMRCSFCFPLARDVEDALSVVDGLEVLGEYKRDDGHELHEDVERRPRGVLERVSHGVTDHGRLSPTLHVRG